jgi:histidinol phosphatase-like enzyme
VKVLAFDLDDVLCTRPDGIEHMGIDKYKQCYPNQDYIDLINEFYNDGYCIVIYTARGMKSLNGDLKLIYEKLYKLTEHQLIDWGVNFNELIMGKIYYDVLIDDKAINSYRSNLKNEINNILKINFK